MSEQQEQEYRLAAAECLERANHTSDASMRAQLLIIAQKWLERANAVFARRELQPRASWTISGRFESAMKSNPIQPKGHPRTARTLGAQRDNSAGTDTRNA